MNFRKDLLDKLNDPNQFWDILKLVYKQKHVNNVLNFSFDKWFQHFKNVFDNDVSFDYDMNDPIDNDANFNCDSRVVDDLNETISRQEIVQAVLEMKLKKAVGPDGLPIEVFRFSLDKILPCLDKLFNFIFDAACIPESWTKSIIIPIFKKGIKMTLLIIDLFRCWILFGKFLSKF